MITSREQTLERAKMLFGWAMLLIKAVTLGDEEIEIDPDFSDRT